MDDPERDHHWRDTMKYNEFHKDGQKEDRTTAEIVEIATTLEDGARIFCTTFLYEVGSRRVASANRLGKVFPKRSLLLSDCLTRPISVRFQLPLPEPCRLLSQHTALQALSSSFLASCTLRCSTGTYHLSSPAPLSHVSGVTPII